MRVHGRIPVCGMISQYNPTQLDGVTNLANLIFKRVKMEGFIATDFYHLYPKFLEFVQTHIREGKVVLLQFCGLFVLKFGLFNFVDFLFVMIL